MPRLALSCARVASACSSCRLVGRGVDLRQHRAFLDDGVVIDQLARIVGIAAEFQNQTHDLRAYVHNLFRLRGPCGADRREQVAPLDRDRLIARHGIAGHVLGIERRSAAENANQNAECECCSHRSPSQQRRIASSFRPMPRKQNQVTCFRSSSRTTP